MKRRLLTLLSAICLLLPLQVTAAENNLATPPYFLENSSNGSVTIPWNADYIITLAGGAGSSSTGRQGGNGYVVSAKLSLKKGDVLSWTSGTKGAVSKAGTTSRGGGKSILSLNGNQLWVAGGGVGATPAYSETARTVTTCSMVIVGGDSGGSDGYVQYHTCSSSPNAPCYNLTTCLGNKLVGGKDVYALLLEDWVDGDTHWERNRCRVCGKQWVNEFGLDIGCPNVNVIMHTCGKSSGQVTNLVNATPGSCSGNFTSQSLSNSGTGYFSIKLADRAGLAYANTTTRSPYYKNTLCNLIIRDDTVVYYKRR